MSESAPPASRRPGEPRSAIPGLTLLCANVLLGAVILGSFVWPGAFGAASLQPAVATPTPTAGDLFDISAPPTAASTITIATTTAAPSRATATPHASHAAPTATTTAATPTPTPSVPTPTALPVSPKPSPTILPEG